VSGRQRRRAVRVWARAWRFEPVTLESFAAFARQCFTRPVTGRSVTYPIAENTLEASAPALWPTMPREGE
jgi:hypothetical protein